MPAALMIRLSPSGPFIADSDSGEPLLGGDGTPGLIWRAQGSVTTATDYSTTGILCPGMTSLAWALPVGYKYDVRLDVQMVHSAAADVLDHLVQYSVDNEATWLPGTGALTDTVCRTYRNTMSTAIDENFVTHQEVLWDFTGAALPTTHLRVLFVGPATSTFRPAACALRIWQYVT